jgi:NAD(P)H-dependent FMN reductase
MYIPVILGTAREGRQSEKVAAFIVGEVKKYGLKTELLDARNYRLRATDNTGEPEQAKKLGERISKADALILVSPEYNYSYPGELKMMLDMLYEEYKNKPVGICCVSGGSFGGARMLGKLRDLCLCVGMVPIQATLYFGNVMNLFDDQGNMLEEKYLSRTRRFLDELVWFAKKLEEG